MQPCDDLRNIILQLYEKEGSGRLFVYAKDLYSRKEGVLVIGSDPKDRYQGYEQIIRFYQEADKVGPEIKVDDLKAYSDGPFGWVVDLVTARLPNGAVVPVRHTYVFHKENHEWKVVHAHISVCVPDESFGIRKETEI